MTNQEKYKFWQDYCEEYSLIVRLLDEEMGRVLERFKEDIKNTNFTGSKDLEDLRIVALARNEFIGKKEQASKKEYEAYEKIAEIK